MKACGKEHETRPTGSRTPLVDAIVKKFPHSAQLEELARTLESERDLLREREAELVAALQDAKGGMALAYHCAERKFNDEVLLHLGVHEARIDAALAKTRSTDRREL
jgi:hypothetical protein